MKKRLLSLCILLCLFGIKQELQAQIKITDFPTYVGNPTGGWVPIVINGINRKMNADLIGYNQVDSFSIGLGTSVDTFYFWKHGSIDFYKTYTHSGGGGSGITSLGLVMPGGFLVTPGSLTDPGTFTVSTNLNGVVHVSGGSFSGGQIIDADVHDINFGKLTSLPTTKAGYNITDVMSYFDTISLSNRIDFRLKYTDTSSMLNTYFKKTDTSTLSNRINLKVNISDTSAMLTPYFRKADTSTLSVSTKLNKTDTTAMLSVYLRKIDTNSLSNRINLKVNTSDTSSMLSVYLRKNDTISLNNRIALKVAYTDTSSMLIPYLRKVDTTNMLSVYLRKIDTNSLSNRINLKVNISDTSSMLSKYLRKSDTSSMLVPYLKSSIATTLYYPLSSNPSGYYKSLDTSLTLATQYYVSQHGSIYTAGYGMGLSSGAFFVDTSTNKIATQNYVLTHAGTLYSAGNGLTLTGTQFKADTSILATQYDNGLKLNKTDTSSMLSPYIKISVANVNYYPRSSNPANYLTAIDTGNIPSFSVKVRNLFSAGSGITYNSATGIITNSIINNNQLTNGAGYLTGINSSQVITALGYTPVNPNGSSTQVIKGDGSMSTFAFNNLTDVTVTSPSNNQLMRYNTSTGKWNNFTPTYYQPTDTLATLATKTNIVKDTVIGFQVGDGGSLTPSNGTTTYSNPLLQFAQVVNVFKGDTVLPTFAITGGKPYVTVNSTTGILTLHNTTFLNGQAVSIQYTFGNGTVTGGGGGGGGSVTTVFGRAGAVIAQSADYASFYFPIPTGTTGQYIRGDGSTATFPTLATVATTGNYNDLTSKPVIPTNTNQLTNGSGYISGITGSMITTALGYTPFNPSGSSTQYTKGDGTFATTDTSMIPLFYSKVRSLFTAGSGISITNGSVTTNLNSTIVNSAIGYTPVNPATTVTINGITFDLSANRTYNVGYASLSDVNLTSISDGQLAKYNSGTGKWINFTPTYLSAVDTTNISNFYIKVRSLFSAGTGISISNGVVTNTINNTNQLVNGAGFLSTVDTTNITNFSVKVRSLFNATGGGLNYTNGTFSTDTTGTLATKTNLNLKLNKTDTTTIIATQYYVSQHSVASVVGTTNQITASNSSGAITLSLPSNVHIAGTMFVGGTNGLQFGDNGISGSVLGYIVPRSDGVFEFGNSTASGFGRLMFGGSTSSNPAIVVNGTGISIKSADNSVFTNITANGFVKNGGTVSQYLMGDGSVSTIGSGLTLSTGVLKADTSTTITGLTTLYQSGLKVKYSDTSSMLSPYLRSAIATTLYYPLSSNPSGYYKPTDTLSTLATQYDLNSTIDTIRVVPYTNTGITLLRFTNDSLRPKPLIAGTNITLTQNTDSTVTISSSGSGSTNSNVGSGYRFAVSGTNNIKTIFGTSNQISIDSSTNSNALTVSLPTTVSITNLTTSGTNTFNGLTYAGSGINGKTDVVLQDTTTGILYRKSAQFVDTTGKVDGYVVTWNAAAGNFIVSAPTGGGGSGTTNSNVGTGYRLAIPNSNNVKTLFGTNILFDSTSNTNGITLKADTSTAITGLTTLYKDGLKVKYSDTSSMLSTYANIGRKNTFSVKQTFSDSLIASSKVNFSGLVYAASNTGKVDVLTQDTTTGYISRTSAQFVDTTGAINGSSVIWNSSANNFSLKDPGALTSRTTVADAAYSILATDYLIAYTSLTTGRTATLPTAVGRTGKVYIIKDESGNAGTSNITIATTSAQTIDGSSTKVINTAYGNLKLYSNGTNWFTY